MAQRETWNNVEIITLRRSGKWLLGVVVQETDSKKRRLKLFKGAITSKGKLDVVYKDKTYKISLVQRFNIPNKRYWLKLNQRIIPILNKYLEKNGQKTIDEF